MTGRDLDTAGAASTMRRVASRGRVVSASLLGVAVVLAAAMPIWVDARIADAAGTSALQVSGLRASPPLVPVALAAGAGAFALTLVDNWGRRLVSVIVGGCGIGLVVAAVLVLLDPSGAVRGPGVVPVAAATTVAPWVAIAGAVVVLLGAGLALVVGDRWPARAARQASASARTSARRSDWDALSEGDDPT